MPTVVGCLSNTHKLIKLTYVYNFRIAKTLFVKKKKNSSFHTKPESVKNISIKTLKLNLFELNKIKIYEKNYARKKIQLFLINNINKNV